MALSKLKDKLFGNSEKEEEDYTEEFYEVEGEKLPAVKKDSTMILLEPRAYSESKQIADYLKQKASVIVNLRRVTPDQAKRIVDSLSGAIYAIGGDLQKLGGGIFLCAPSSVSVEGKISDENVKANKKDSKSDVDDEFDF